VVKKVGRVREVRVVLSRLEGERATMTDLVYSNRVL
jgi:hypothetical protein